jgi:hypothetical protein
MALEKELDTYRREFPKLLNRAGKFALVQGDAVISVWDSYEDAIQEGYRLFSLKPFLVKQILAIEQVHHFTRGIEPVCQS